jgi:hypothetical protein
MARGSRGEKAYLGGGRRAGGGWRACLGSVDEERRPALGDGECGAGWAERCLWESRSRGGLRIYGAAEKPGAFRPREGNAGFVFVKP